MRETSAGVTGAEFGTRLSGLAVSFTMLAGDGMVEMGEGESGGECRNWRNGGRGRSEIYLYDDPAGHFGKANVGLIFRGVHTHFTMLTHVQ